MQSTCSASRAVTLPETLLQVDVSNLRINPRALACVCKHLLRTDACWLAGHKAATITGHSLTRSVMVVDYTVLPKSAAVQMRCNVNA